MPPLNSIFVCYRRQDSGDAAGRIYDRMIQEFGAATMFRDVDKIPYGVDYRNYVVQSICRSRVGLVLIGPEWAATDPRTGQSRLNDPEDPVRIEVETMLGRKEMIVIPLFVRDASFPPAETMPESLAPLMYRNGTPIRRDPDFSHDMDRLIEQIRIHLGEETASRTDQRGLAKLPVQRAAGMPIREALCCFAVLLISLASWSGLRETGFRHSLDQWIYNQLQLALIGAPSTVSAQDITIVDIGGIRPEPAPGSPSAAADVSDLPTPREPLLRLVGLIAEMQPQSIGIDVDFSADESGPITPRDPEYFREFARISAAHHVPIYLGVYRQRWKEPAEWLGGTEFSELAAAIAIPTSRGAGFYLRWQRAPGADTALPGMAIALAGRVEESGRDIPSAWEGVVRTGRHWPIKLSGSGAPAEICGAFVDYSKLASLEGQFLRVVHPETLADNSQRIRGRSVLLGDASEPQHRDHFNIGDLHPEPLSGVYLHACAVLTAAGAPLVELTAAAAAGLDVAFASAIAALIFFAAYKRPRQNWPLLIVCGLSIATGWLVSIAFIRFGRIVWMDLAPLTAGLFLYALVAGRVFRVAFDGNPSDRGRA